MKILISSAVVVVFVLLLTLYKNIVGFENAVLIGLALLLAKTLTDKIEKEQ